MSNFLKLAFAQGVEDALVNFGIKVAVGPAAYDAGPVGVSPQYPEYGPSVADYAKAINTETAAMKKDDAAQRGSYQRMDLPHIRERAYEESRSGYKGISNQERAQVQKRPKAISDAMLANNDYKVRRQQAAGNALIKRDSDREQAFLEGNRQRNPVPTPAPDGTRGYSSYSRLAQDLNRNYGVTTSGAQLQQMFGNKMITDKTRFNPAMIADALMGGGPKVPEGASGLGGKIRSKKPAQAPLDVDKLLAGPAVSKGEVSSAIENLPSPKGGGSKKRETYVSDEDAPAPKSSGSSKSVAKK